MASTYTAGSFTKNCRLERFYEKLHAAIRNGFSGGVLPISRDIWRKRSKLRDRDRELIPLNFFLFLVRGLNDDFVVVDRLVERAFDDYDVDFAKLALFAFHLAMSGTWRNSKWPDGRVAGWANDRSSYSVWSRGQWRADALSKSAVGAFIETQLRSGTSYED